MRARTIQILIAVMAAVAVAISSIPASAEQTPSGTSIATSSAKKKKKKVNCSKKAVKKLKGKAKKKRVAACKKAKKKAKKPQDKPGLTVPGAGSGPDLTQPKDYAQNKLSERTHEIAEVESIMLPTPDGKKVYVEVYKPKTPGKYGVILEASPYHGTLYNREGWRILPQPAKPDNEDEPQGLVGYFVPRGYVVVMMDLRGTGKSEGCLDHLGQKDGADLKTTVEWAASQAWSNGKVGMVGHSYVGSSPAVAAAMNPKGLETVVLSAGLASMYDHQFQWGVPWMLQYAGPVYGYQSLAIDRALPPGYTDPVSGGQTGDNFGNNPQDAACGVTQNAALSNESMSSGKYDPLWHGERDWREGVKNWNGKVWVVHGVNDNAARIASIAWFNERGMRAGDKFWLGQWDHGIGCCPTRRGLQWTLALHAWFDKTLLGRDVDTGPPFEAFINDATDDPSAIDSQAEAIVGAHYPVPDAKPLTLAATPDNKLTTGNAEEGSLELVGDASGFNDRYEGGLDFESEPLTESVVVAGLPKLDLAVTQATPRMHLVATIYQLSAEGSKRRIATCAMNAELRDGIDKLSPVVPGMRMLVSPPCFTTAHHFRAGTKIGLKINTSDPDHAPTHAEGGALVHTGAEGTKITLPTLPASRVSKDAINLEATGFSGSGA
jgi:predicted acyl esterase